ncbi:unnamed protein product [Ostreobium quekettii]|uniref:Rhodanese domain-containing protein n=1 Tax=Ostreobium quekettii TaxID=121088 RepID=A0A8S1IZ68_9CHLO|nr:unnamed protein product [Ostreobium quekettii]
MGPQDVCVAAGISLELSPLVQTPGNPVAREKMYEKMRKAGVAVITVDEMLASQAKGIPVLDVRPKNEYEKGHIPDSVNIPLYDLITGWQPYKIARRGGHLIFGSIDGTEFQEDFLDECVKQLDREMGVTVVCNMGATLEEDATTFSGRATRSLMAAHELVCQDFKNVSILQKGVYDYITPERELSK